VHVFVFSLLSDYTFILNLFISVVKRSYWNLTPSILVLCRFKVPFEIGILTHKNPSRKQIFFLSFLTSFSYFAAYFLYNYSSLKTSIDMIIFLLYLFLIISTVKYSCFFKPAFSYFLPLILPGLFVVLTNYNVLSDIFYFQLYC